MPQKKYPKLSRFYGLALLLLAVAIITGHLFVRHVMSFQSDNAEVVNISGRQRMLSQRISLLIFELANSENQKKSALRKELIDAKNLMLASHNFLSLHHDGQESHRHEYHDDTEALQHIQKKHITDFEDISDKHLSPVIHDMYFEKKYLIHETEEASLDDLLRHYLEDVDSLLQIPNAHITLDEPLVLHIIGHYPHEILPILDDIVFQYEDESNEELKTLERLDLLFLIATLCVLGASGLFIFRPMEEAGLQFARELEAANRELEGKAQTEKLAALGELSGGIAHEINNALQPIIGLSEIIAKRIQKFDDQQSLEYMKIISDSANHAKKIVSNILAFARNQHGEFRIHRAVTVAEGAADFARIVLPSTVELEVTGIDNLKDNSDVFFMRCDMTALSQVTMNLMKNASDAMDEKGTVELNIHVTTLDEDFKTKHELHGDNFIVFEVKDHGCGIHTEVLEKVFDPFFTTKDEGKGTGLGLSVSYGIIQSHQGIMTVHSEPRSGTTFSAYIPLVDKAMYDAFQNKKNVGGHA